MVDLTTGKVTELVSKQARQKQRRNSEFEEQKSSRFGNIVEEQDLWKLQINKTGDIEAGFKTNIAFESNPFRLRYDAAALSKVTKFFKTGLEELSA